MMFNKSDVLVARFTYSEDLLVHNCIVRLADRNELKVGTRFGITVDADARVGKEILMTLSDISGDEHVDLKVNMITAEHISEVQRGWFSIVEVTAILSEIANENEAKTEIN
jgi:hypothetical protein